MEDKLAKPIEGVYVQLAIKGKVVQKFVPLSSVVLKDKTTLAEYLSAVEASFKALNEELQRSNAKISKLEDNQSKLEKVFADTIRGFITK